MKYIVYFPDELVKSFAKATLTVDVIINDGKVVSVGGVGVEECESGKWVRKDNNTFMCPICGNFLNFRGVNAGRGDANYCPNCGTELESEVEE